MSNSRNRRRPGHKSVARAASFTLESVERRLLFASIAGVVFGDYNSNGVQDPGEPGLPNWTVYLDGNDSSTLDASEVSTVTGADGSYSFPSVGVGTYRVREILQSGWAQTAAQAPARAGSPVVGNVLTEATDVAPASAGRRFTATEVIARVDDTRGLRKLDHFLIANPNHRLGGMVSIDDSGQLMRDRAGSLVVVHLQPGTSPLAAVEQLQSLPFVTWAEPNYIFDDVDPRDLVPNDPSFASQYHHTRLQNALAWDTTLGNANILIGVTDDGVMLNHPDLQQNIYVNTGEIAANGVDDDGNGYVDDVNGWDFTNSTTPGTGDNNALPATSGGDHGTHVAGIAAARTNNGVGVAGTAGGSTIVPLRFYGTGSWTATVISNTYRYAADMGLQIVTTSYNVDQFANNATFRAAVQYMYDRGVLHFNSAGNNNALNPPRQQYDTTLYVASTTSSDTRAGTSNYGWGIDVAAPGDGVFATAISSGTFPNYTASYETKSGTSMATPNAAGVAALIWSANPTWTRDQVAAKLLGSTDNIDGINASFAGLLGRGRVNSFKSLTQTLAAPRFRNNTLTNLPAENATVTTVPTTFALDVFNVFDPATMNAGSFEIRGAGFDDQFGTADDVLVPFNLRFGILNTTEYQVGTNRLNFQITGSFGSGKYRFSALPTLTDPFGQALDGNGDGTGGDAFSRTFNVVGRTNAVVVAVTSAGQSSEGINFGNREIIRPAVLASGFEFETGHAASARFSKNVAASLDVADLTLQNLTTAQSVNPADLAIQYVTRNDAAVVTYAGAPNGALPDGDYRLTFAAAGVADLYGNTLAADATVEFFVFAGDANRDRTIDIADFSTLAANFNAAGTFSQGDFDYNGQVDIADFSILASKFNQSLPAARVAAGAGDAGGEATRSVPAFASGTPFASQPLRTASGTRLDDVLYAPADVL